MSAQCFSVKRTLSIGIAAVAVVLALPSIAHAVDCPTAQTLTGSDGFGQAVAMYNDGVTGEYLVVSSSTATYVYRKGVGSTVAFRAYPSRPHAFHVMRAHARWSIAT
jgi:hypothetical protein